MIFSALVTAGPKPGRFAVPVAISKQHNFMFLMMLSLGKSVKSDMVRESALTWGEADVLRQGTSRTEEFVDQSQRCLKS